jgi:pyridoxamine 5'-phosphate oxidase
MTNPIERFIGLLDQARAIDKKILPEPTAFSLATADEQGRPSVRIVLLKDVDEHGFVFYTNYESRKGRELLATRRAALCFHWMPLEVQVRVEGGVTTVTDEEADAYFASRPRGSQIGAWASTQSRTLARRADLEARVKQYEREYEGKSVVRPKHWSGFRVAPDRIEFWKGMPSRLHEREVFHREGTSWRLEMLFP